MSTAKLVGALMPELRRHIDFPYHIAADDNFTKMVAGLESALALDHAPLSLDAVVSVIRAAYGIDASGALHFSSRSQLIEFQLSVAQYLEDEDADVGRPQSPRDNYIAGFVVEPAVNDRNLAAHEFGDLGKIIGAPDDLTVHEATLARLLTLRLFGGWSLRKIAHYDNVDCAYVTKLWSEARIWARTATVAVAESSSLDLLDRRVLEVISEAPHLLHALEWRTFERLLAAALDKLGYTIELQRGTKDGGIDVIAIRSDAVFGGHRYLIQAKRWRNRVGVSAVRELLHLKTALGASKACLATTSRFTRGARALAAEHRWELELRDFDALVEWLSLSRQTRSI